MNINFGTEGYIIRYLQTFLKDNFSDELLVTGKFDEDTHQALIGYLDLPNVEQLFDVESEILQKFPDLEKLFFISESNDKITFLSKIIDEETANFINLNISEIRSYLESIGWVVESYRDYVDWTYDINEDGSVDEMDKRLLYNYLYNGISLTPEQMKRADINNDGHVNMTDLELMNNYIQNDRLYINIASSGRINYFPNQDMKPMINLFPGTFLYYTAFRSNYGATDFIHDDPSGEHKVCIIKCKPETQYTIAHGAPEVSKLIIGSYVGKRTDLTTMRVQNVINVDLAPGIPYVYTTTSDATYLVIQCDSNMGHTTQPKAVTTTVLLGDINQDGIIDAFDKKLLADYLFYPEGHPSRPIFSSRQKVAADINNDGKIDEEDMARMNAYLNKELSSLGTIDYTYYEPRTAKEQDIVVRLLVTEGDITDEILGQAKFDGVMTQVTRSKYGINFESFATDPWIVHEKFIPYLLGMAIHKYSRSEEITYVQDLLTELYPITADSYVPGYFSDEMKDLIKQYQKTKYFLKAGDMDADGEITQVDEKIVREYLDGEREFTDHEVNLADVNNDGNVEEIDYLIMRKYRAGITDSLSTYTIPFYLGWIDPQTEAMMLKDIGKEMNEVGWKY